MARVTSRADLRGGPTSRASPSVLPMRLSHRSSERERGRDPRGKPPKFSAEPHRQRGPQILLEFRGVLAIFHARLVQCPDNRVTTYHES